MSAKCYNGDFFLFWLYGKGKAKTRPEIWIIECKYRASQVAAMNRKKEAERQQQRYLSLAARKWTHMKNPMQIKICQRSAPVWLMSVLQIRRTIPYNARKAVAEVRKIEAGKGITKREDMEKAFPPVLSTLNLVVVVGYAQLKMLSVYAFRPVKSQP